MLQTRILLVDDDSSVRGTLAAALERVCPGAVVESAATIEEAERLLSRRRFDLVVSDYFMGPGPTGVDFLQFARDAAPQAPRVLVTGHGDFEVASQAVNRGDVSALMGKPVRLEDLRALVGTLLPSAPPKEMALPPGEARAQLDELRRKLRVLHVQMGLGKVSAEAFRMERDALRARMATLELRLKGIPS